VYNPLDFNEVNKVFVAADIVEVIPVAPLLTTAFKYATASLSYATADGVGVGVKVVVVVGVGVPVFVGVGVFVFVGVGVGVVDIGNIKLIGHTQVDAV
jgi:hypothetical protein